MKKLRYLARSTLIVHNHERLSYKEFGSYANEHLSFSYSLPQTIKRIFLIVILINEQLQQMYIIISN